MTLSCTGTSAHTCGPNPPPVAGAIAWPTPLQHLQVSSTAYLACRLVIVLRAVLHPQLCSTKCLIDPCSAVTSAPMDGSFASRTVYLTAHGTGFSLAGDLTAPLRQPTEGRAQNASASMVASQTLASQVLYHTLASASPSKLRHCLHCFCSAAWSEPKKLLCTYLNHRAQLCQLP